MAQYRLCLIDERTGQSGPSVCMEAEGGDEVAIANLTRLLSANAVELWRDGHLIAYRGWDGSVVCEPAAEAPAARIRIWP